MKNKFDKYWGECNLLMAIVAILDSRQKMRVLEFVFPKIYSALECQENITKVQKTLFEMYKEYVSAVVSSSGSTIESQHGASQGNQTFDWNDDFDEYCEKVETLEPRKSELQDYVNKPRRTTAAGSKSFDCLEW